MNTLSVFSSRIPNINGRSAGELIPYFAYYLLEECNKDQIKPSEIAKCFEELAIMPYSNISSYLSSKAQGKNSKFLKKKSGYSLQRAAKESIREELALPVDIPISDALLPLELLEKCPYYIIANAKQMDQCYECGLYDATLVMMRKLMETLIIECFEKFSVDSRIKDDKGNFFYLSELIPLFVNAPEWNVSRNLEANIKCVKKYGDLSAHNRRFLAKPMDLNHFKFELRQVVQEIVLLIDYKQK